jgi:hypothetical protein
MHNPEHSSSRSETDIPPTKVWSRVSTRENKPLRVKVGPDELHQAIEIIQEDARIKRDDLFGVVAYAESFVEGHTEKFPFSRATFIEAISNHTELSPDLARLALKRLVASGLLAEDHKSGMLAIHRR